jgi:hypothetical protein
VRSEAATLRLAVFPRPTLLTDALLVVSGTALLPAAWRGVRYLDGR